MKKIFFIITALLPLFYVSCKNETSVNDGIISSSAGLNVANVNGEAWTDTEGNIIQSHDGIIKWQGKYYWYGIDYSHNLVNTGSDGNGFRAVKCYESEDLVNWKFKNNVLTANSSICLNQCDINNVRVVYNKNTGKFVMWMGYNTTFMHSTSLSLWTLRSTHNKLYLNANLCATANSPYESFDVQNSFFYVNGGAAVTSLFVDDDGTGYCMDWANYNNSWRLYINKLSDDFLSVESNTALLFPETYIGRTAIVKHNGYYYLFGAAFEGELDGGANGMTSADGWLDYHFTYFDYYRDSSVSVPKSYSGVRYCFAESLSGEWSGLLSLGKDYADYEFSDVIKVQGTDEVNYILTFNKWNTSDLSSSGYLWQPLMFAKETETFSRPYVADCSKITINAEKGTVKAE